MFRKQNNIQVNNPQVTNNIINMTNTITTTGSADKTKSIQTHSFLKIAIPISILLTISISISIVIYNCNNPKNTLTIPIDNPPNTPITEILDVDYYTKTIIHGSKTSILFDNRPVISITIPQYKTNIVTDKSQTNTQEITKTTKTNVKIADITHIYYPDADDYEEIYNTYYIQ